MRNLVVLGGPNGAGKTTAAPLILPQTLGIREFVNADEIARGLSPYNPEGSAITAGRLMIARIRALARAGASFAFETTCAGRAHARLLRQCRSEGYRVVLVFLWLPSAEAALARVARRVREGGHDIPEEVVVRRYAAGLSNMRTLYMPLSDAGLIYDNSDGGVGKIAEWSEGTELIVHHRALWQRIEEATR